MPNEWTGALIGRMHNARVTRDELAAELGYKKAYVSLILNGKRTPKDAQNRLEAAFERILERRASNDAG